MSNEEQEPRPAHRPPSLEHPLPIGMRDLLPEEAEARRTLGRVLLDRFALFGYALVTPPVFEFADVLERGLGTLSSADVLRFVEPESGEVAALRPDMTTQVARIVATRLAERPPPFRLCYEGTVLRRRAGRARRHRQIPQVGVELAGVAGPGGDLELLEVAADALRSAGLGEFTLDLGAAGIARSLLSGLDSDAAAAVSAAMSRKDAVELAEKARETGFSGAPLLSELLALHGGREAIVEGGRLLAKTPAARAVSELLALFDAAAEAGLGPHLMADLGEVRGFAYYTGPIVHLYAEGPGGALGSGGRYDELLAGFGAPMPAVGFALDLDHLAWALRTAGVERPASPRAVVVGDDRARLATLRAAGIPAAPANDRVTALSYARAWGFSHVVDGETVLDARGEVTGRARSEQELEDLVRGARGTSGRTTKATQGE